MPIFSIIIHFFDNVSTASFCTSLLVVAFSIQVSLSRIIYVIPESQCPSDGSTCQTLDWYNQHFNKSFLTSNTEVRFLEGIHTLTTSIAKVKNLYNITITGFKNTSGWHNSVKGIQPISMIHCKVESGLVFFNSSEIHLNNIAFESCGARIPLCSSKHSTAALSIRRGNNIKLHRVMVSNTRGFGLHTSNVFGLLSITESAFVRSIGAKNEQVIGNARFRFGFRCGEQCSKATTHLDIVSSWFMDGQVGANGLEVIIGCPSVYVNIKNTTISNNTGKNGGNLALSVTDLGTPINKTIVKISNCHIDKGRAKKGGGMRFWSRTDQQNASKCTDTNIHRVLDVYNTTFHSNFATVTGGAVYVIHYQSGGFDCIIKKTTFTLCNFQHNFGNGAAMEITKHLILADHVSPQLNVSFKTCAFLENLVPGSTKGPVLSIIMSHITMTDCTFAGSNGTAISLQNSNLNLYGNICFENNHAKYGGALKVCERSFVFLHNDSCIQFVNNTALMGGAVYVQESCLDTAAPCAFQPAMPEVMPIEEFNQYLKLEFVANSASIAGDVIYGGSLDTCYTIGKYSYHDGYASFFNFLWIFHEIFDTTTQTGSSFISSYPQGVCFCGEYEWTSKCRKDHSVIKAYPGEIFNISAITVGQLNGTTIGTIESSLKKESVSHQLAIFNGGKYSNQCVSLSYSLLSKKSTGIIVLKPSTEGYHEHFTVDFTVHLLHCPLGFELLKKNGQYRCDCSTLFSHHLDHISDFLVCDITTQTINLKAGSLPVWLGCHKAGNRSQVNNEPLCDVPIVSQNCDYYCLSSPRSFSIHQLDQQCLKGRMGVLCGACKPGLSHILGLSHECRMCSDKRLFIYIPSVLLSGVLIMFFLTILNITVTEGTINGPIFYTTFLFTCRYNFFYHTNNCKYSKYLWAFVAWLNLDSGFDACAYNGMTGYQYIWVTFGYVFYLFFIQAVMIFLSRKYIFFTRLFGRNVLKVLATLLFLTHSPLMYACFHALQLAHLYESAKKWMIVWYFDGNIPYLGLKHTPLFILASICLFLMLFFIVCLLFIQCLQKWSDRWYLRWVERLRPFFEAFTGPCRDEYRFWPGLLHLIRTLIYGLSMYFDGIESRYRHVKMLVTFAVCVILMTLACIFPHSVYKKWPLNVLEFFFLLNLSILCIFLGYYKHPYRPLFASVSLVMVTCFGILLYHIHRQIKGTQAWTKIMKWISACRQRCRKRRSSSSYSGKFSDSEECDLLLPQPLPIVIQVHDYREPLLDD